MANMCSNFLEVSGEEGKVAAFYVTVKKKIQIQRIVETGTTFIASPTHFIFDLWLEGESIGYETKWAPNIEDVKRMHKFYGVDLILEYIEPSSLEYGRFSAIKGEYIHQYLDESDVMGIEESEDTYFYRGQSYESEEEIWELILEEKYKQKDE